MSLPEWKERKTPMISRGFLNALDFIAKLGALFRCGLPGTRGNDITSNLLRKTPTHRHTDRVSNEAMLLPAVEKRECANWQAGAESVVMATLTNGLST